MLLCIIFVIKKRVVEYLRIGLQKPGKRATNTVSTYIINISKVYNLWTLSGMSVPTHG